MEAALVSEKAEDATATNQSRFQAQAQIEIHPDAVVVAKATILKGNILIGPGTVIHPQAYVDAGDGTIMLGANNIIEETAIIQNLKAKHVLRIGDDNLFEIGSVCHAIEIGDNNVFGIQSTVGMNVKITTGCRIGARCKLLTHEEIPPLTVIGHGQRKTAYEKPTSQKSQAEFLKKLLPKYSEIIRNKKSEV